MEGRDQPMSEMSRISEDEILYLIESARPEQQQAIRSQEPLVVVSAGRERVKRTRLRCALPGFWRSIPPVRLSRY